MEINRIIESNEIPPKSADGNFMHKFEVKMKVLGKDPQKDGVEKAVFIDGKKLDFKIDVTRFLEAKSKGINFLIEEQKKIEKEFVKSVSEVIGRKVTTEEIKKATVTGWI
jgi:hypothetical protein